jgi:CheY-like chemotaxis protein
MNDPTSHRIIIAEDDPVVRSLILRIVQRTFPVALIEEAGNGQLALDAYQQGGADLVILDHHMPDLTGLEVTRRIRQTDERVPIIMISGDTAVTWQAPVAGVTSFVAKPFTFDQLRQVLLAALAPQ